MTRIRRAGVGILIWWRVIHEFVSMNTGHCRQTLDLIALILVLLNSVPSELLGVGHEEAHTVSSAGTVLSIVHP